MKKSLLFAIVVAIFSMSSSFAGSSLFTLKDGEFDVTPTMAITQEVMSLDRYEIEFKCPDGHSEVLNATSFPSRQNILNEASSTPSLDADAIYKELQSTTYNYKVYALENSKDWSVQEIDKDGKTLSTMMIWEFADLAREHQRPPGIYDKLKNGVFRLIKMDLNACAPTI